MSLNTLKIIICIVVFFLLETCESLNYITYDCPNDFRNQNISISDTLSIQHPVIVSIHEGRKQHDLLIPYSSIALLVHENTRFTSLLKNGGMLIAYHSIESYNSRLHSSVKDSDLMVKVIAKIGHNEVKEFEHPITKFLKLKVSKGCYNYLERNINWIPLKGKNSDVEVLFPLGAGASK